MNFFPEAIPTCITHPSSAISVTCLQRGACRIIDAKINCMPFPAAEVTMGKRRKKLQGTVQKIIKPLGPSQPDKAQITFMALTTCTEMTDKGQ
jgi:hypothetical protein